MPFKNI